MREEFEREETINSENENEFSDASRVSEAEIVEDEVKKCRYCGRKLNNSFDFCTFCGKSQHDMPAVSEKAKDGSTRRKPEKRLRNKQKGTWLIVLSAISFSIAFIALLSGLIGLLSNGAAMQGSAFGSIFGSSDNSRLIINFANITASLLLSILFFGMGAFFTIIKKIK